MVSNPEQIPQVLGIAMRKAILNKGVSVVVIPGDIALKDAPESAKETWYQPQAPLIMPQRSEIENSPNC